ncbi:TIGR02757 family protein [Hydrogenimonas sp.]
MNENVSTSLRNLLLREADRRNDTDELSGGAADPLQVAAQQRDDRAILLCALFGYGNAVAIVKFLRSLDFSLLNAKEPEIRQALDQHYYRFQSSEDVVQIFLTFSKIASGQLEEIFMEGYSKKRRVIDGVFVLLEYLYGLNEYRSRGYEFLLGKVPEDKKPKSAYKRWMMFLRWMVRHDNVDLGRWKRVSPSDLIMPLDTHTFHVSRELGLLNRKSCDWKAAILLTEKLKSVCPEDPVRFDFALYRIGQEKFSGVSLKPN